MGKNNHGHHGARRKPSKPEGEKEPAATEEPPKVLSAVFEKNHADDAATPSTVGSQVENADAKKNQLEDEAPDPASASAKVVEMEARWKEAADFAAQVQAEEEAAAVVKEEADKRASLNPTARAFVPGPAPAPPIEANEDAGRAEALRRSEVRKAAKVAERLLAQVQSQGSAVVPAAAPVGAQLSSAESQSEMQRQVRELLGGAAQPQMESWEAKAESDYRADKDVTSWIPDSGTKDAPGAGAGAASGPGAPEGRWLGWGLAAVGVAVAVVFVVVRSRK